MKRQVVSVCVWYQYDDVDEWVVSLEDVVGDEIECIDGYGEQSDAWERAVEEADDRGIPARLLRQGSQEEIRRYEPE